ncbi:unnamed protein product [Rodentolepis nana]|uniref:Polyadenylate-binding protein 6-like n=1 Tax=Rodentolepis nana TaxID=102285 RepID=A0A0R3TVX7_RODNA|nr:unnamed protein product [Rodentolepis nana]
MCDCVIYVGDLDPLVTLDELAFTFSSFNCQLISVKRSKNGTCFALLRFQSEDEVNTLMSKMRNLRFRNRPIRLMRFQPDPCLRNIKAANVFVGNIDECVTQEELHELFSSFGEVLSCKIATNDLMNSRGYGYVQYSKPNYALGAVGASGTLELADKKLVVKPFKPRNERYPNANVLPFTNCYVKNFDRRTTEADLRKLFGEFGEIGSIFIPTHSNNVLKGYAFVCFKRFDEAWNAVRHLNGKLFRGQRLYVSPAEKKADRIKALNAHLTAMTETGIFVKDLDERITEFNLYSYFGQFGKVLSAKLHRNAFGRSKGLAYVWFQSPSHAKLALKMKDMISGAQIFSFYPIFPAAAKPQLAS